MDKHYDPHSIESHWGPLWEQRNYGQPSGEGTPFCIMLPPPNVTGSLHMGHGFQQTLMDTLIRYHRMRGDNTLWQPGTDHAGIATQMVVERRLAKEGQSRHDIGREVFVEKIWEWKQESGGNITRQMRRLGTSVDWSRECFTMDANLSAAVQKVFIDLYREELIYHGLALVNWDPKLGTAISNLEVINQEEQGSLWYIRYPLADDEGHLIVATTRPETLLGDSAVAVHPDDERYQHLIGKHIALPLTDRTIPIIADDSVVQDFGSGCVKITPAHDFNDYAMGKRHDLPLHNVLNPDATLNDEAPEPYRGLDRFEARKRIVADLDAAGWLDKTEPHTLMVPRGDRSGVIIEPYLTKQWFVCTEPLAKHALEAVKRGDIEFVPGNWVNTYNRWLEDIEDWCISRQLWWGHRIPAWFDDKGQVYVGKDEADVREHYKLDTSVQLTQDDDVLDTWFSSALWPFSTLGWPDNTAELDTFFPTSVLVTGFDIIFFWVARMIMMSLHLTGKIPFHHVYITGLIRDQYGQKMSKTKGNVLDPVDLIDGISLDALVEKRTHGLMQPDMAANIEKATREEFPDGIAAHGTDALRFTYCALASTGRDIRFDLSRLTGYRNFCNKLWNATRYVLMQTEGHTLPTALPSTLPSVLNRWILSELQTCVQKARDALDKYRFDFFAQTIHTFVWNTYCDWYLELSKPLVNGADSVEADNTRYVLVYVLETLCRLIHPVMPFITEEIWQQLSPLLGKSGDTIMQQPYPEQVPDLMDDAASETLRWLQQFITEIRTIRAEMQISPAKAIPLLLHKGSAADKIRVADNEAWLCQLAKLESITWHDDDQDLPPAATAVVDELICCIPLEGLIDKDAELARLDKALAKLEKEVTKAQTKLDNPRYVDNAPAEVVAQERERLQDWQAQFDKLSAQRTQIAEL